jgi:hypothetical protein
MVRGISKPTLESHKFTLAVIGTPSESGTLRGEKIGNVIKDET